MAWLYWQKLNEIYSQLDTVDFRMLEVRDFSFGALDLSGAGWCWCLPKEGGYIPVNAMEEDEEEGVCATAKSEEPRAESSNGRGSFEQNSQ